MGEVVLARGAAGWRAAAVLAARGLAVRWLVPGDEPAEDADGAFDVRPEDRALVEAAIGPLIDVEPERAVFVRGRSFPLPLSRRALADALGPARAPGAGVGWIAARVSQRVGNVFDLGGEERSYLDFVRNRLGRPAEEGLFTPYATRRFATPAEDLAAWLAWRVHFRDESTVRVAPRDGWAAARAAAIARIRAAGGDVIEGANPVAVELSEGRIAAIVTDVGREHASRLWSDLPIPSIGGLLPASVVDETWRFDVARLRAVHRVDVVLSAEAGGLPWKTYVVDPERAFYEAVVPDRLPGHAAEAGRVTFRIAVADDDPRWRWDDLTWVEEVRRAADGLCDAVVEGAQVIRRAAATPVATRVGAPSLGRRLDALDAIGWIGIGPGSGRDLDPSGEIELVSGVLDAGPGDKRAVQQREVHRQRFERPVRLPARVSARAWATG